MRRGQGYISRRFGWRDLSDSQGAAVTQPLDDRSPHAKALSKVTQITSISLMMIVPAMIGYFIDQRFKTLILFTSVGLVLGISCSVWQLVKFVGAPRSR